ncbi:MAG: hypothetical protein ACOYJG_06015 [Prevotella sp.]|jgi:hypothetical protein
MNRDEIQQLLNRYMDGQTTREEEIKLSKWMATHDVPPEWQPYKEMLSWIAKGMPLTETQEKPHRKIRLKLVAGWVAAAAVIAALFLMVIPKGQKPQENGVKALATLKVEDSTQNVPTATSERDSATNRNAEKVKPFKSYRRFHRSMLPPRHMVAQTKTDSVEKVAAEKVNAELNEWHDKYVATARAVDSLASLQNFYLEAITVAYEDDDYEETY